jgi:hypothetical protein
MEENDTLRNEMTKMKENMRTMIQEEIQKALKIHEPIPSNKEAIKHEAKNNSWAKAVTNGDMKPQVKKREARKLKAEIDRMIKKPGQPAEFKKIVFKLQDSRPLKNCTSYSEVTKKVTGMFQRLQIKDDVFMWSKIGNSIIEIIVPEEAERDTKLAIFDSEMELIDQPKLWLPPAHHIGPWDDTRFIKRNAFLYRTARLVNIRKCIIESMPEQFQDAVKEQADLDRQRLAANRSETEETSAMNVDNQQLE